MRDMTKGPAMEHLWKYALPLLLGIIFVQPVMRVLFVPEEILDLTATYVRIIFIGTPFTFFTMLCLWH